MTTMVYEQDHFAFIADLNTTSVLVYVNGENFHWYRQQPHDCQVRVHLQVLLSQLVRQQQQQQQ
jgi:hypothetical protein